MRKNLWIWVGISINACGRRDNDNGRLGHNTNARQIEIFIDKKRLKA